MGRHGRQGRVSNIDTALIQMGDRRGWFRRRKIEISDAGGETAVEFRQPDWRGNARSIDHGWLMGDPIDTNKKGRLMDDNNHAGIAKGINYTNGLRRMWFASSIAWFFFAIFFFDPEIEEWLYRDDVFDFFKVLLFPFWPVVTYPAGRWVIQGFVRQPSVGDASSASSQDLRATHPRHPVWAKISSPKGLFRLWLVATAIWYLYAAAISAFPVAEWVGFHYALIRETGSVTSARERIKKMEAIAVACQIAIDKTCWVSDPKGPYGFGVRRKADCEQSAAFNDVFNREAKARGIDIPPGGLRGAACPDIVSTPTPRIDWAFILLVVVVPFAPLLVYRIGRWVVRGFSR